MGSNSNPAKRRKLSPDEVAELLEAIRAPSTAPDKPSGVNAAERDTNELAKKEATTSLDDLQSKGYRDVLDTVDKLRSCGLGDILSLPQIVVCGNQSSGKSSVLEAITEVPFPRKENLCTRFATEIVLRRGPSDLLRTKIVPDKNRPESEKAKLQAFDENITDLNGLPELIDKATEAMGLDIADGNEANTNRAFTRDFLTIEIFGPSRPQLTLVDLPGLIQSANKMQTDADIKLIHSLVDEYIAEKRTIILAIISAKDDFANQAILSKSKEVDVNGDRTLGIITKPDYLRPSSDNETKWFDLAQNKDIFFALGWHMLKNRSEVEMSASFAARNAQEEAFFRTGQYKSLAEEDKGIVALRTKLSRILFQHMKKELPNLQAEIHANYQDAMDSLRALGENRSTVSQQKRFLLNVAASFQTIVNSAADGHYENQFFGSVDADQGRMVTNNVRRLRAVVQQLNLEFAGQMRRFGHKYAFPQTADHPGTESMDNMPEPDLGNEFKAAAAQQIAVDRKSAVDWVYNLLVRTRGRELPGNFNPLLISYLFWEQSENWESFARAHIERISSICSSFIKIAIEHVCNKHVSEKLLDLKLRNILNSRRERALQELACLIRDKNRHPITYDPNYTATVQQSRSMMTSSWVDQIVNTEVSTKTGKESGEVVSVDRKVLKSKIEMMLNPNMDQTAASDALDSQLAYYKDKVKFFVAAVTEQAIERHLLDGLADATLSPLIVNDMSDDDINYVAAELESTVHLRKQLQVRSAILENSKDAIRKVLGSHS